MTPTVPLLTMGQVVALNAPGVLQVIFKFSGQGATLPVKMGLDYADGRRVRQTACPNIGTWGLVAFPGGDVRNGIWICSVYPSMVDVLTGTQASGYAQTDPFIDYTSHFSGHWELLDGQGNQAVQWADGSSFVAGASSGLPTTYRHTTDANNNQLQVVYQQSERIPSPPSVYTFAFAQSGKTSIVVDTSGNVTINLAAGAKVNIVDGGAVTDSLVRSSELVTALNSHIHSGVTTGTGNSLGPVVQFTSGAIQTTLVAVQS